MAVFIKDIPSESKLESKNEIATKKISIHSSKQYTWITKKKYKIVVSMFISKKIHSFAYALILSTVVFNFGSV
jgi:hypothetical protein